MSLKLSNIKPFYYNGDIELWDYSDMIPWSFTAERNNYVTSYDDLTGYEIKTNNIKIHGDRVISSEVYDEWKNQIVEAINDHNSKIYNEDSDNFKVEFKMLDVDDDYAYTYEKYVNGKLVFSGKGWLKDLKTKIEKEAWRKAVKEYKKENGIETESDKRKKKREKTKKKIKQEDEKLPEPMEKIPPTIINAIAKATNDPCEFITEILQKGTQSVTGMSPKELINYYTKLVKNNVDVATTKIVDGATETMNTFYLPVEEGLSQIDEYFAQLDSDREEWLKQHSDDVCLFELVESETIKKSSITSTTTTTTNVSGITSSTTTQSSDPNRKVGTLEWNNRGPNENVITKRGELWNIIYTDLGPRPTSGEASRSMKTIEVKTRDPNGVMKMRWITVHKAAVGTVKQIFEEIYNTTNFKVLSGKYELGGFNHRPVRKSKTGALSQHSWGSAIDINPSQNPMLDSSSKDVYKRTDSDNTDTKMRTVNHKVVKILAKYGYGWGGCYSDYMHFSCKTYINKDGWFSGR